MRSIGNETVLLLHCFFNRRERFFGQEETNNENDDENGYISQKNQILNYDRGFADNDGPYVWIQDSFLRRFGKTTKEALIQDSAESKQKDYRKYDIKRNQTDTRDEKLITPRFKLP